MGLAVAVVSDGLGVIWECDNCHAVTETGLDDEPTGWLVEEFDEDDYAEDETIPDDLILCADCYVPANIFRSPPPGEGNTDA